MPRTLTCPLSILTAGLLCLGSVVSAQAPTANPVAQIKANGTNPPATAQGPSNGANVTPGGATGANVSATATGLAGGGLATAAGVLAALGLAVAVGGGNNGVVTTTTTGR